MGDSTRAFIVPRRCAKPKLRGRRRLKSSIWNVDEQPHFLPIATICCSHKTSTHPERASSALNQANHNPPQPKWRAATIAHFQVSTTPGTARNAIADKLRAVFSPDGHVFQVEYALEAVKRGTCAVGVKGAGIVVLGCEKRSAMKLQDTRITPSKISLVDTHVTLAFAGLNADARILVDKARLEAQSHRLTVEDPVTVEYITKYVAGVQQRYTQSGGVRPFGISTLVVGFDPGSKEARLYQTEPSGIYSAWYAPSLPSPTRPQPLTVNPNRKANAIGRSSKTVREFLERNHKPDMDRTATIELTIKSLLEVVQTGAKNIEIAILTPGNEMEMLAGEEIEKIVEKINTEKETEASQRRGGARGGAAGTTTGQGPEQVLTSRPAGEGAGE